MYFNLYRKERPNLITRSLNPENQETPIHFIPANQPVSESLFYRRNHFPYPILTPDAFTLKISGSVKKTYIIGYSDLLQLPSKSSSVLIECSGNKRAFFNEKVFGEQWESGAMSEGVWRGIPLATLLKYSGIKEGAKEIAFRGRDSGIKNKQSASFERSLEISKALDPEVMIAYEYNGKPLSHKHGFPFRLIVPNWYGMASVKWLAEINVIDNNFTGPFQTDDYIYYYGNGATEPVTENNVNSTIQQPLDNQILPAGEYIIKGIAWTGSGLVDKVELSFNKGEIWESATLTQLPKPHKTVEWKFSKNLQAGKEYYISVRATDSSGRIQPTESIWNKKGYGYNGIMNIQVKSE